MSRAPKKRETTHELIERIRRQQGSKAKALKACITAIRDGTAEIILCRPIPVELRRIK